MSQDAAMSADETHAAMEEGVWIEACGSRELNSVLGLLLGRIGRIDMDVGRLGMWLYQRWESGSCTGVELDVKESGRRWKRASMRCRTAKLER